VIFPKLQDRGEQGLPVLTGEIAKKLPVALPSSDAKREKLAKRQANAAVALLRLNRPEKVWPLLKRTPADDPRVRSYLIHRFGPMGADPAALVKRLEEEPDVTIRRALILSLGPEEFGQGAWTPEGKGVLVERLQELYRTASDPGLHAAAEWLLRQWKQEAWLKQVTEEWAKDREGRDRRLEKIQELVKKDRKKTPPQWYVNGQGQTMVVIPGPVEFLMGSPPTEEGRQPYELQHQRRIGRSFALAAKAVTVREFRQFLKANRLEAWFEAGGQVPPLMKRYSPDEEGPIIYVDWYGAAAYCNWLSKVEGIPEEHWCYATNLQGTVTGLKAKYLSLQGYRLPTEAEMEYACRAGAVTSRSYGETEELLERYGWYLKNSKERAWPVGRKKPNDLGLCDLHGNVYTWCQESYKGVYPTSKEGERIEDKEDILSIKSTVSRVLRGGSFFYRASIVRSAVRNGIVPTNRTADVGFRPARTFTP
jgi:formylglycine-generating enzyme required for sulfatase activity